MITDARQMSRIVIFSLRIAQTQNADKRNSHGLATYMQLTIGMGYISIAQDLVNLIRALCVNATYGTNKFAESPAAASGWPTPQNKEDLPRKRFWVRRFADMGTLAFIGTLVPGILANSHYSQGFDNASKAHRIFVLRSYPPHTCPNLNS